MNTQSSNSSSSNSNTSDTVANFQAAFESTAAARAAVKSEDIVPLNIDIPTAVTTVLGVLPRAMTLRSKLTPILSAADIAMIDAIETYAVALSYAHTVYLSISRPTELPALLVRATQLRDLLVSDATALSTRGLIDSKVLADLKGGVGYLAVAYDLGALVRVLRECWTTISAKTAIQPSELDEAEKLFEQVTRMFAARSRTSTAVTTASDDRARAYTLFANAYDKLRSAVTFIRWTEDDADKFAPSIHAGHGGHAKAPAPNPAPAPTAPAETTHVAPVAPVAPVEPGMPGGSPFTH